ncbi:helix-turn-helix domain-containing protein [Paenibacillus sp. 481]|uniref:helix-turn-helix domain-containing protein n=1 Tax=Paenibacillus sp. 481 TaxID=2835869 RepID=UPI001E2CF512|nr:helix-turn-helix transcriptional regulator [Paenibacillus sp. 481]UHA72801.1 helix-turn-helix transcriptional regulator [Paenibacillus sp. 481]
MPSSSLEYTRIGDLIRHYRNKAKFSLKELARRSDISKGNISKIENGDVKKPDFQMLLCMSNVLNIPYSEMAASYIEVEKKSETLLAILMETIQRADVNLVAKVAAKFLASDGDSYELVEQLSSLVQQVDDTSVKLTLTNSIIDHSLCHGIMPYIAKGLYQKYMLIRNDFTQLQTTFQAGKNVLTYVHFLNPNERLTFYQAMSIHAYCLMRFDEAIQFSESVLQLDNIQSEHRANALFNMCNAYFYLGKYDVSQVYLHQYSKLSFPFVADNVKLKTGFINGRLGNVDLAITQIRGYLHKYSNYNLIFAVTELMDLYMLKADMCAASEMLNYEDEMERSIQHDIQTTPFKRSKMAYFYQQKGHLLLASGQFDEAINSFLQSTTVYVRIGEMEKAFGSFAPVTEAMANHISSFSAELLHTIDRVVKQLSHTQRED